MNVRRKVVALLVLGFTVVLPPRALAGDVDRLESVWWVPAPPSAHSVIADSSGSVMLGDWGDVWATEPIGGTQWRATVTTGEEITPDPPAMDDGLVVVPVDGRRVVALDRHTGAILWEQAAEGVLSVAVGPGPVEHSVAIVTPEHVSVVSGVDGSTIWTTPERIRQDRLTAVPRGWFSHGRLVVAWADFMNYLRAYDAVSGSRAWSVDNKKWSTMPAVFDDGVYFVANVRKEKGHVVSKVRSLEVTTGAERWSREVRGVFLPTFRAAADATTVTAADLHGTVIVLDRGSGRLRWRERTGQKQYENQPSIVGPVVAMTTYGTGLVALSTSNGLPILNEVPGRSQTSAVIEDSTAAGSQFYVLVHRGSVDNGELWMLAPSG